MLTHKTITELVNLKDWVKRDGPVYKNACCTETVMQLHCLTALGLLNRRENGHIVYWEYNG